jgi:hypothetical protein
MIVKNNNTGQCIYAQRGTGHCGDSYVGSASIRAGNGTMMTGAPSMQRIM